MAVLEITPQALEVRLNRLERIGAFHDSFAVPWEHIDHARAIKDLWPHVLGWRVPGLGIPHVILLGTMRYRIGRDFTALYKNLPGVVLELHDEKFRRLLVSAPNADDVVRRVITGA
jgi:hypothetical protein